jgi:hypothetical protein
LADDAAQLQKGRQRVNTGRVGDDVQGRLRFVELTQLRDQ